MGKRKSSPRLATTPETVMLLQYIMADYSFFIQKQRIFPEGCLGVLLMAFTGEL
ncbi:hypothetical protein SAMN05443252_101620 [Bacillus sp. OV322]|uniref:hypothetical protein n=1 Tax=Bacillus sp. OV322 TaxID=1882764 RepID=UPI0008E46B28|nr:hypothetical protein [Bacillus sp. OV322]SFC04785.1 hypothetical protein SAMN05443252_101620 [Bacillus sp. OV322]